MGTTGPGTNELDHAEIMALRKLEGLHSDPSKMTLYATMEPCLMCFGAILIHRIGEVVYAYEDVMGGGTGCALTKMPALYRDGNIAIISNVLREKSLGLFKEFFSNPENSYWKGSLLAEYTLKQ
jgi:tRNA(adenine34) deaminase